MSEERRQRRDVFTILQHEHPHRTGGYEPPLFSAGKLFGSAIGVALLTTVLAAAGPTRQVAGHLTVNLTAYHTAFVAAAAVAGIAVVAALTLRDADAASTMHRQ